MVFKSPQTEESALSLDEYIISPVHLKQEKSSGIEHSGLFLLLKI